MDSNKIQEFIQYLQQNNQQDSLSDYFVKYSAKNTDNFQNELPQSPPISLNDSFKIKSPILPNTSKISSVPISKKTSIKSPENKVEIENNTVNSTSNNVKNTGTGTSFKNRQEFINAITPAVKKVAAELGIDPNIIISQAVAEQGDGRTDNVRNANNIFNISGASKVWKGPVYMSEDLNRKGEIIKQKFRKYATIEDSVRDWADLMKRQYGNSLNAARKSPEDFFRTHAYSGYAEGVGPNAKENLYKLYKGTYKKYIN